MTDNSSLKRWYLVVKRVGCSLSPYFLSADRLLIYQLLEGGNQLAQLTLNWNYLPFTAITYLILMLLNFNCNYLLRIDITYLEI